jgi:lipid II:glycine glycyltransferase (peptidoglycan interpeptide bridge formation enzyme)
MEVKLIDAQFDPAEFNRHAIHPMQSWEWGEAKKELGNELIRIGEFHGGTLENVFQITLHQIPKTQFKVGYMPKSVIPSQEVITFLKDYGKRHNIVFIKMEPNITVDPAQQKLISHYQPSAERKEMPHDKQLLKSVHPLFPEWTQAMDLSKSEEELLKNLKSKTRYNIRLAEKKGVVVKEESDDEGFEKFKKLYFETTKRQKYFGHDEHYHTIIWKHMKKGFAHILIPYFKDTPLAAYELFYFNNVLYYPYGGSSDKHRNLMGANLLMWTAIKLGKQLGAAGYDMWGSLPPTYDQNDPWAGFTRFKEGYNAEFVHFIGSYDLVISPVLYQIYNVAYSLRNTLLKLRA